MAAAFAVTVAGGVASNLVAKVLELLGEEAVQRAASWRGARDDLNKLKDTMVMIQARVDEADRRQEGENSELIKHCLQRLKLVLFLADDLFDEVVTLDLLKHMEKRMFSMCRPTICYNRRLANEIKSIRRQLEAIESNKTGLPPVQHLHTYPPESVRFWANRETTSIIKKDVIGREIDQDNIIEMLLDPNQDREPITFIFIVGSGGLGKTTLAQLVCNDHRVTQRFDRTAWAYVPQNELHVVKRKIFQAFTQDPAYLKKPLQCIEQGIIDSITNKKYLLVLDDLWTEGADSDELRGLLRRGKNGSKVIVTTRNNAVAMHLSPARAPYRLGTLTNDQSWEMFKSFAFQSGQESSNPELTSIGREIVEMCGNLPLAIEVIAASIRGHSQPQWLQMKNDLSEGLAAENDKIMAILKPSYDRLPSRSKPCFAYCSVVPKGYEFEKDDVVKLWLAQGYIGRCEEGECSFSDLVARNLLQGFKVDGEGNTKTYKMHDLLNDLALKVAGNEVLVYERQD